MSEFNSLANLTIKELEKDNMLEKFIDMNEEDRAEILLAYANLAVKRFESFSNKYMNDENFAKDFRELFFQM